MQQKTKGVCLLSAACAIDLARLPTEDFETSSAAAFSTENKSQISRGSELFVANNQPPHLTSELISNSASLENRAVVEHSLDLLGHSQPVSDMGIASIHFSEQPGVMPEDSLALQRDTAPTNGELLLTHKNQKTEEKLDINAVNAPLDALLFSLAAESGLSLKIRGEISGQVTLRLMRSSLSDVLDQLSGQVPFAWVITGRELRIHIGSPYRQSYAIDYLNLQRHTRSSVGLATRVGTINAANSDGDSVANSSQTRVENNSNHDFWSSLQADIRLLLGQGEGVGESLSAKNQFSVNIEAGLLTLFATPDIHNAVSDYLGVLKESTHRQVLIEATVLEVTLSDSYEAGVDWQLLARGLSGFSAAQILVGSPNVNLESVSRLATPAGLFSVVQETGVGDISATLSLLEQFGDIKILSRPRIMALNNQSAVLKVVDNRVYFTTKVERSQSETQNDIVTETEIHTVPIGLVMNVTPQISRSGSVMLNIRPTLSRIIGFVNDPNPELALANVQNGVPEIQVREMESVLKVSSGKVAIIGGLMQESREAETARLPGLGKVPMLGQFFSQRKTAKRQTELLVVLRPTVILNNEGQLQ